MKKVVLLCSIVLGASVFFGCQGASTSSGDGDNPPPTSETRIYIGGDEDYTNVVSKKTYMQVKYWTVTNDDCSNMTSTLLSDGPRSGNLDSIKRNNNNVYSAGQVQGSSGEYKQLWINDSSYPVGEYAKGGRLYDMIVDDKTVYLCGYEIAENGAAYYDSKLWIVLNDKTVEEVVLTKAPDIGQYEAYAYSVCFDDSSIYVVGYEGVWSTAFNPMLWIVNKQTHAVQTIEIENTPRSCYAESICEYNGDIYIGGSEKTASNYCATYWYTKGGDKTKLYRGSITNSINAEHIQSIVVKNENVYISGYETTSIGSNTILKYWKNGVAVYLTTTYAPSLAGKMFVTDSEDVYIVGSIKEGEYYTAYYWKNGVKYQLSSGSHDMYVSDIYVEN